MVGDHCMLVAVHGDAHLLVVLVAVECYCYVRDAGVGWVHVLDLFSS